MSATLDRITPAHVTTNAPPLGTFVSDGPKVIAFIETMCVHTKGRWRGQPFKLLAWEKAVILWMFRINPASRLRIYRRFLLGIPKKNGKTELAAALALYGLLGDGEIAPEVYCAANSDDQADLVFGAAKTMCELSPRLAALVDVFASEIQVRGEVNAKLVRLSGRAPTKDGLNVHMGVFDEFHEAAPGSGEVLYTVLSNGVAAREQPVMLLITTAGHDIDGTICGRMYTRGVDMAAGTIENDPSFLFVWFGAPPGQDYRAPEYFKTCNPSYGVTVLQPYFDDQVRDKSEGTVRRYNGNEWTDSEDIWLPFGAWEACSVGQITHDTRAPMALGIDSSWTKDSTAVIAVQWQDGRIAVKARIWERPIDPRTGASVTGWVVPMAEVKQHIRDVCDTHNVERAAFDPRYFITEAEELDAEGYPMVAFPPSNERVVPASQRLYTDILKRVIAHEGDPVLARHVLAAVIHAVAQGDSGWKLAKGRAKKRIDGCVALMIAVQALYDANAAYGTTQVIGGADEDDDEDDEDWGADADELDDDDADDDEE